MKFVFFAIMAIFVATGDCLADGCVSGNCVNGYGTYVWSSGSQYSGDWKNQQRYGYGTFVYSSGETYTGNWKNNKKHGQGTYIWPGGYQFFGGWMDNLAHGKGVYTYPNGERSAQVLNMGQLVSEEKISRQNSQPLLENNTTPTPSSPPSGRRWKKAN